MIRYITIVWFNETGNLICPLCISIGEFKIGKIVSHYKSSL